ncbi:MAG: hypothetical protein OEO79_14385 [Gemmatimonadota bacterium]|nr:hypothetical protein [Gemmatimonadota bacterium]
MTLRRRFAAQLNTTRRVNRDSDAARTHGDEHMGRRGTEALGALGVIAGLVFVGFEIGQNTRAIQGATVQAVADANLNLVSTGLGDDLIQAAWGDVMLGQAIGDFDPVVGMKLAWYFLSIIRMEENRFRQISLGTVSDPALLELGDDYLRLRAFRDMWEGSRDSGLWRVDPAFAEYLNERIEDSGPIWTAGPTRVALPGDDQP